MTEKEKNPVQNTPHFYCRFFAVFKKESGETNFPKLELNLKSGKTVVSCFQQAEHDRESLNSFNMLHPQARDFLSSAAENSVVNFHLARQLADELQRTTWKTKAPKWAISELKNILKEESFFTFRITEIKALLFPTGIFCLHYTVEPGFELIDTTTAAAGKMILNTLNQPGSSLGKQKLKTASISRVFSDERQHTSVVKRMGENKALSLIKGLCGEEILAGDIVESLLTEKYTFLMGDRFVTHAFIKTFWDGQNEPFTEQDYIDLVRLSRGQTDRYLPDKEECQPDAKGILTTFKNVAFGISAEGVACWIKPAEEQPFLHNQFTGRFDTIYLNLYLLSLHQKYALVYMAKSLQSAVPPIDKLEKDISLPENEQVKEKFRSIENVVMNERIELIFFFQQAFFEQPAILTNHQKFYQTVQEIFGISDLLEKVQQVTFELEHLIGIIHKRTIEKLESKKKEAHRILTLVVEAVGIPYYLYNFLSEGLLKHLLSHENKINHMHHEISLYITIFVTLITIAYTFQKFYKKE